MTLKFTMQRYIFITGGVLSSLGKGVSSASIGLLLKSMGYKVSIIKLDPYLNVDAGTMNPFQHGEVFVTEDGGETDLDIGHYERFLGDFLSKENNITSGQIYLSVIQAERRGDYLGSTVQIVPHLTNEIKRRLREYATKHSLDILIVEVGGTVGDIESLPFLEAIRQMRQEEGFGRTFYIHVGMLIYLRSIGELKTKPMQHSINKLREIGIQPDAVILRSEVDVPHEARRKIAMFGNLPVENVFISPDLETVYELPLVFHEQRLHEVIAKHFQLEHTRTKLDMWKDFVVRVKRSKETVRIALVGKYVSVRDAYKSIYEALVHAGAYNDVDVVPVLMDSEDLEIKQLGNVHGILVPGGFGRRGIEGKLEAIRFARENNVPFLGICLGMQLAVVEFARNVLGLDAHSTEFYKDTPHPVVHIIEEAESYGGTLRLGASRIILEENSLIYSIYRRKEIYERHRHRYEVNENYIAPIQKHGMKVTGWTDDRRFVEVVEIPSNDFFVGVQFHPEFRSQPLSPSPIFVEFVKHALKTAV